LAAKPLSSAVVVSELVADNGYVAVAPSTVGADSACPKPRLMSPGPATSRSATSGVVPVLAPAEAATRRTTDAVMAVTPAVPPWRIAAARLTADAAVGVGIGSAVSAGPLILALADGVGPAVGAALAAEATGFAPATAVARREM
jgi:hypothetical protein